MTSPNGRKRAARFKVAGDFDGQRSATVVVDAHLTFRVRPRGRRRTYDLPLPLVAEIVLCRVAKAEAAARAAGSSRPSRRGRGR